MKKFLILVLASTFSIANLSAENGSESSGKVNHHLQKFDTNKDGRLDPDEKKAAYKENEKLRAKFIKKYDSDLNGTLSEDEFKFIKSKLWKQSLALFDSDKDGKLNVSESAKRTAWLHEKHPGYYPYVYKYITNSK